MKVLIFILVILGCLGVGLLSGRYAPEVVNYAKSYWLEPKAFYITTDQELLDSVEGSSFDSIGWSQLLPESEKQLLTYYLPDESLDFTEQIRRSIEASSSEEYRSATYSTNIVETLPGKSIAISGFIVPIELGEGRTVQSFFLVPYFGACIHYPPPPPNQMIYVSTPNNFPLPDMYQAYTLKGVLKDGLYEDLLGTSAYQLDLISVTTFQGTPDDFRQH